MGVTKIERTPKSEDLGLQRVSPKYKEDTKLGPKNRSTTMDYPFKGDRKEPTTYAKEHKYQPGVDLTLPDFYQSTLEMVNAVNVALLMNMPLLLTGEPGSGKTQLAYRVAWELGFKEPPQV